MAIYGFGHSAFCTKDRLYYCKHKVANGLHSTDRDQLPLSSSYKPLFLCTPAVAASVSLIQSGIVRFRGWKDGKIELLPRTNGARHSACPSILCEAQWHRTHDKTFGFGNFNA